MIHHKSEKQLDIDAILFEWIPKTESYKVYKKYLTKFPPISRIEVPVLDGVKRFDYFQIVNDCAHYLERNDGKIDLPIRSKLRYKENKC